MSGTPIRPSSLHASRIRFGSEKGRARGPLPPFRVAPYRRKRVAPYARKRVDPYARTWWLLWGER